MSKYVYLTLCIFNIRAVTFESEFAAEATACDKAYMKVSIKSNVILELGSDKDMCFTNIYNTFRGGSSSYIPADEKPVNLVQCIFDMNINPSVCDQEIATLAQLAAMCTKRDGTAGTETCECKVLVNTQRTCATDLEVATGTVISSFSGGGFTLLDGSKVAQCGVSQGGFCNRLTVPITDREYIFDLEDSASKAEISLADLVSILCRDAPKVGVANQAPLLRSPPPILTARKKHRASS